MAVIRGLVRPIRRRVVETSLDQYGEALPAKKEDTQLPVAVFQPGGMNEPNNTASEGTFHKGTATLYWRGRWPDLVETDQVLVSGQLYSIDGKVSAYPKGMHVALVEVTDKAGGIR